MKISKTPTLRLKALNKHSITHIMYIEMENVIRKNLCTDVSLYLPVCLLDWLRSLCWRMDSRPPGLPCESQSVYVCMYVYVCMHQRIFVSVRLCVSFCPSAWVFFIWAHHKAIYQWRINDGRVAVSQGLSGSTETLLPVAGLPKPFFWKLYWSRVC